MALSCSTPKSRIGRYGVGFLSKSGIHRYKFANGSDEFFYRYKFVLVISLEPDVNEGSFDICLKILDSIHILNSFLINELR